MQPLKKDDSEKADNYGSQGPGIKGWLRGTIATELTRKKEIIETNIQFDKLRIAILPFLNISPDPADEYFADGMTEELISTLSKISGLNVISRTSVMQYKSRGKAIREIGRELFAGTVVEGSVRKAGNRIRIGVEMIDPTEDRNLWAENYDRVLDDVFAIQSEIAQQVALVLKIRLLTGEKKDIGATPTENTEAYQLFLKGRYYFNQRWKVRKEGTDKAVICFEQALELDPKFALAYSALAGCYIVYSDYGLMPSREAYQKAKEYALKAIQLDSRLAEAYAALGTTLSHCDYKWNEAEEKLKRAIELNPSYATAYHWLSLNLRAVGRLQESYESMIHSYELDPLSPVIELNVAEILLAIGKPKDAMLLLQKVVGKNPDYAFAHLWLGWGYYLESEISAAIQEVQKSVTLSEQDPLYKAHLACLLGFCGRRTEAIEIVDELTGPSKGPYVDNGNIAYALFGAGRNDEAFAYLDKAYQERSYIVPYLNWWPWFRTVRKNDSTRWSSFQKRVGFITAS